MSEVAPDRCPQYCRRVPERVANEKINELVRMAIKEAIASGSKDSIGDAFFKILGEGVIDSNIELAVKEYPDEYVARQNKSDTALRRHSRADYRSNAHSSVLSPVVALKSKDSPYPSCVGTDKLAHMFQQGFDYWVIYTTIEAQQRGMGRLFASAWGYWSEGEILPDEFIENYLMANNLPSDDGLIALLRREIDYFLGDSETIEYVSPTPAPIKDITPLRKLSHFIGVVDFGCLGLVSNGIVSYADIAANEAGLDFYLDLERDPEYLAENFDIANYATISWDEEVLKSRYTPKTEERVKEAVDGEWLPFFVYGFGVGYEFFKNKFSASMPFLYYPHDNFELRLSAGAAVPVLSKGHDFANESEAQLLFDTSIRISGLWFATASIVTGASKNGGINPAARIGPEFMALGRGSIGLYYERDLIHQTSSLGLGFQAIWR